MRLFYTTCLLLVGWGIVGCTQQQPTPFPETVPPLERSVMIADGGVQMMIPASWGYRDDLLDDETITLYSHVPVDEEPPQGQVMVLHFDLSGGDPRQYIAERFGQEVGELPLTLTDVDGVEVFGYDAYAGFVRDDDDDPLPVQLHFRAVRQNGVTIGMDGISYESPTPILFNNLAASMSIDDEALAAYLAATQP